MCFFVTQCILLLEKRQYNYSTQNLSSFEIVALFHKSYRVGDEKARQLQNKKVFWLESFFYCLTLIVRFQTFGKIRNRRYYPSKTAILPFSNIFQRLTVPRNIDHFRHKRYQKKRKDVSYHFYKSFCNNILLYMNGRLSKIVSVHTYGVK